MIAETRKLPNVRTKKKQTCSYGKNCQPYQSLGKQQLRKDSSHSGDSTLPGTPAQAGLDKWAEVDGAFVLRAKILFYRNSSKELAH